MTWITIYKEPRYGNKIWVEQDLESGKVRINIFLVREGSWHSSTKVLLNFKDGKTQNVVDRLNYKPTRHGGSVYINRVVGTDASGNNPHYTTTRQEYINQFNDYGLTLVIPLTVDEIDTIKSVRLVRTYPWIRETTDLTADISPYIIPRSLINQLIDGSKLKLGHGKYVANWPGSEYMRFLQNNAGQLITPGYIKSIIITNNVSNHVSYISDYTLQLKHY